MHQNKKIKAFSLLRQKILKISDKGDDILVKINKKNPWFIPAFCNTALKGIAYMLEEGKLQRWLSNYPPSPNRVKNVGIVMAGNIPAVGFHDLLSVVFSGHQALIQLSRKDDILIPYLTGMLYTIEPEIKKNIQFVNSLHEADAVIATGSDNTARYFEYQFRDKPRLIRKNRTSCCIISGNESKRELEEIADDIFMYFGLGCRNISKIYVPRNYDLHHIVTACRSYSWMYDHQQYCNNYKYQVSKHELEKRSFTDGRFFILEESPLLVSPISCLYYEEYDNSEILDSMIAANASKIQCIVSKEGKSVSRVRPGMAQYPDPWDYADNVDTMSFLNRI